MASRRSGKPSPEKAVVKCDSVGVGTAKAVPIVKHGRTIWIPRSQISYISPNRDDPYVIMSLWLATREQLHA